MFFKKRTKYILFILLCFIESLKGHGQPGSESFIQKRVKQQAVRMGQFLLTGDYSGFASCTYPKLLIMIGGKDKMVAVLGKTVNDMKAQGMTFSKVSFEEPTRIIQSGNEMQCTILQHTEIKLRQGRVITTSTLIAISTDSGKDWTFVDTSNKDMSTIRKLLPHLSNAIIIPPQQPPVQLN